MKNFEFLRGYTNLHDDRVSIVLLFLTYGLKNCLNNIAKVF
jgi:hypothetical protein